MKLLAKPIDAILFDIDNVLIDTRRSYTDAIRWTIEIYLTRGKVPLFHNVEHDGEPTLLTPEDVDHFKMLGGFNDDWDCCYGLLVYLLSIPVQKHTLAELKKKINIEKFAASMKTRPLGVNGIVKLLGRPSAILIERIARIFQEIYLGRDLFEQVEKRQRVFWKKNGLIHKEKLIFRKSALEKLKEMGISLGIATGRPRFEALYSLKMFDIVDLFDHMTTMDEVKKAEQEKQHALRKPHPFSLLETAKKIGQDKTFFYVGDLPDDIMAAERAKEFLNIRSVAFPAFANNPQEAEAKIKKCNPDFLIKKTSDLFRIAKNPK